MSDGQQTNAIRANDTRNCVTPSLAAYIEENVFPVYALNDDAHGLSHIEYVIRRSLRFVETVPDADYDMAYAVAAYHDVGHHIDPARHEIVSAEMMMADEGLRAFFDDDQLLVMKEAIEDHRASSDHEPRSVYGRIVSTADRNNTVEACLRRSYIYGRGLSPEASDDQLFERAYRHLLSKFGEGGYARHYFEDAEYESFLVEIRELLSDKQGFIEAQQAYVLREGLSRATSSSEQA